MIAKRTPIGQPSISVVTVSKDNLLGLQHTVHSVVAQGRSDIELVVVDGSSTDGTAEWLQRQHPRFGYRWISEQDSGIYDAMNKGLGFSRGDLVMFLNAGDCFSDAGVLDHVLTCRQSNKWRWAIGISRITNEEGAVLRLHAIYPFSRRRFLWGLKSIPHQAVIMERLLFDQIGAFSTDLGLAADQELMARALTIVPPASLAIFIADCLDGGIGSIQPPGAFISQMAAIRQRHGLRLTGSITLDSLLSRVIRCAYICVFRVAEYALG